MVYLVFFIIALLLVLIYTMISMAIIVDRFVIPTLQNASKKYKLSEQIDGILLAIGASIPELTTNLIASLTNNINIGVGSISGSGAFDFTMCFGIASLFTSSIQFYYSAYLRDSLIYLMTLLLLTFFIKDSKVELYETLLLTLLWPLYLIFVTYCWKIKTEDCQPELPQENTDLNLDIKIEIKSQKTVENKNTSKEQTKDPNAENSNQAVFQEMQIDESSAFIADEKSKEVKIPVEEEKGEVKEEIENNNNQKKKMFFQMIYNSLSECYSYFIPLWPNSPIFCFVITMVLIFFHSNVIVFIIETISIKLGISKTFLGMTLISLGGNIGDTINAIVSAKIQARALITTSTLGSQITNLQLCLGLPWLVAIIKEKINGNPLTYINIGDQANINNNPLYYFIPLIICVVMSTVIMLLSKMTLNKLSGGALILTYLSYLCYEAYIQI